MVTEADREDFKNGLRILARMIVQAHLRDIARAREIQKEENNANQRSKRGCEASPVGENQAGGQE
jgi:hypothetical protein